MSLESAWTKWCRLFAKLEGPASAEDVGLAGDLAGRLRRLHPDHSTDAQHLANVLSALHRGIPLLLAAIGWADVRAGGSQDSATPVDEVRGDQWRLVMAYGGFETVCKALLSWSGRRGLGLAEFRALTEACALPVYPVLDAPPHPPKVRERWFEGSQGKSSDELTRFLGLCEGAARAVRKWLVERKPVSDWAGALDLARALRHAIAHGALSASRAEDWKLQLPMRRLVADLATVVAAAITRIASDPERPAPRPDPGSSRAAGSEAAGPDTIILPGDPSPIVSDLAMGADGRLLACGLQDSHVLLVDLQSGQITDLVRVKGGDAGQRVSFVAVSPDGGLLAAAAERDVCLWRLDSGGRAQGEAARLPVDDLREWGVRASAIRFSPDGRFLAISVVLTGGPPLGTALVVLDVATGQPAGKFALPKKLGTQAEPVEVAFFHGMAGLAAISWGLKICRWPVPGAKAQWAVRHPELSGPYRFVRRYGIAVSPDDSQVAVGSGDEACVHLLDASCGTSIRKLATTTSWVSSIKYSPDGRRLVVGTTHRGGAVEFFDLTAPAAGAARKVDVFGANHGDLASLSLAVHPASGLLVAGAGDRLLVFRSGWK